MIRAGHQNRIDGRRLVTLAVDFARAIVQDIGFFSDGLSVALFYCEFNGELPRSAGLRRPGV